MTQHTACCACGQLQIDVEGEPAFVAVCNCTQCQRRTGSAFGVSSYFSDNQVSAAQGEHTAFARSSDAGRQGVFHFCPTCGSTVFWVLDAFPGHTGVAVGCFADPDFPAPTVVVWAAHKHRWVDFPTGMPQLAGQTP